jgi:hypothetical protein
MSKTLQLCISKLLDAVKQLKDAATWRRQIVCTGLLALILTNPGSVAKLTYENLKRLPLPIIAAAGLRHSFR